MTRKLKTVVLEELAGISTQVHHALSKELLED